MLGSILAGAPHQEGGLPADRRLGLFSPASAHRSLQLFCLSHSYCLIFCHIIVAGTVLCHIFIAGCHTAGASLKYFCDSGRRVIVYYCYCFCYCLNFFDIICQHLNCYCFCYCYCYCFCYCFCYYNCCHSGRRGRHLCPCKCPPCTSLSASAAVQVNPLLTISFLLIHAD